MILSFGQTVLLLHLHFPILADILEKDLKEAEVDAVPGSHAETDAEPELGGQQYISNGIRKQFIHFSSICFKHKFPLLGRKIWSINLEPLVALA